MSAVLTLFCANAVTPTRSQTGADDRRSTEPGAPSGAANGIGPESPLVILMAPSVQKELKLSDDQKTKVYNLIREASQKSRQLMMRGGGDARSLIEAGQQLRRETDRSIGNLLEKKQNARFEQIVLQSEGPLAVGRKEIATKIHLNDNQHQAVRSVMAQFQQSRFQIMMAARRAAMTGAGGGGGNVEQATPVCRSSFDGRFSSSGAWRIWAAFQRYWT